MKMKSKISYGLGLLFFLLFAVSLVSMYYMEQIADNAKAIIKNNYESLRYIREMSGSLNNIRTLQVNYLSGSLTDDLSSNKDYNESFFNFEKYLKAEESNITEKGEKELAAALRGDFVTLKDISYNKIPKGVTAAVYLNLSQPVFSGIENELNQIHALNMKAIAVRNMKVQRTSGIIIGYMSAIVSVCLVLAVFYYWYFPHYVSTALTELAERMKVIAGGRYDKRLNLKSNDEFGEISDSFDKLAEQLNEIENK